MFLSCSGKRATMECNTSVSQSVTDFVYNQSYFVQTIIMTGFISLVFFLIVLFWISSISGGRFSEFIENSVQSWTGGLCFVAIVSILWSVAVETNYWMNSPISYCSLEGLTSISKSIAMFVVFYLQILFIREFRATYLRARRTSGKKYTKKYVPHHLGLHEKLTLLGAINHATWRSFENLSMKNGLFIRCFPKFYSSPTIAKWNHERFKQLHLPDDGSIIDPPDTSWLFFRYGVWMIIGSVYSFISGATHWLKFLTQNLGLYDLTLSFGFLGIEIKYTLVLNILTSLHTKWLSCPFVNLVVDALLSVLIILWFMWRFRMYPRIPKIITQLILGKSKSNQ